MRYEEIENAARTLELNEKLRLAQLLIQLARHENEKSRPSPRDAPGREQSDAQYVRERLKKIQPKSRQGLMNTIGTMFNFRGGISEADKEALIAELTRAKAISINENGRVLYHN